MTTPCSDTLCVLCNEDISGVPQEDIVTLGKKGSATVNQISEERGSEVRTQEGQRVHEQCRKRWGVKYYIQTAKSNEQTDTPSHSISLHHQQCSVNFRTGRDIPK